MTEKMSNLSRIFKNAVSLLTAEVVRKLVAFLFITFVIRYLPMADFGIYTLIITFIMFAGFFANFGIETVIIRDVAKDRSNAKAILSNAVLVLLSIALVCWILMSLIAMQLGYALMTRNLIVLAGSVLVFEALIQSFGAIAKAYERMEIVAGISGTVSIVSSLFGIALLKLGFGLTSLIWLKVISTIINALCLVTAVNVKFFGFKFSFNHRLAADVIKQAFPIAMLMACTIILKKIDIIMLSKMKGIEDVAIYGVPVRFTDFLTVCTGCVLGALFPFLSVQSQKSEEQFKKTYDKSLSLFVVMGLGITLMVSLFAGKFIMLLFGSQYAQSVLPLRILLWGFFFGLVAGPIGTILIIQKNKLYQVLFYTALIVIVNIVLNLYLIPKYGVVGASISTLLCAVLVFIMKFLMSKQIFGALVNLPLVFWRPLLAASVSAVTIWYMRSFNLFVLVPLSAVLYMWTLILLGEFKQEKYDFLMTAIKKAFKG